MGKQSALDIKEIKELSIFKNMNESEISDALLTLRAVAKNYEKGALILNAGSTTDCLGIVLDGSVTIESVDLWGNRTILSSAGKGHTFAETYALLENEPLLVDVYANENCRILFLRTGSLKNLIKKANSNSSFAIKLLSNLLIISSHKNLILSGRSFHTSHKTIRGRVMAYLSSVSYREKSSEFDIPFDRQQLADYLGVERTALSKELGKMQRDGLISFRKNHFDLKKA